MQESADALISRYLSGGAAAFEELYGRYASRLLGFVISLGAPREAAEDVAQKAWLRAIEALPAYEPRGRFRPWLFTLAHRLWLDEARSAWQRKRAPLDEGQLDEFESTNGTGAAGAPPVDPSEGPRERAIRREQRALVEEGLAQLPETMRQTVLLRIDGDLTHREIAEAMDCPLGTVLWRMHEAQKRLTERLAERTAT